MSALSNGQKAYLSQLSDRAFNRLAALAHGRGEELDSSTAARAKFRHEQVAEACGKLGLRCCSQDDYKTVEAHFLHLLGEDGRAMKALVRGEGNPRRVVEWKITKALEALGRPISYADGICRRMYHGTALMDASDKQLWKLFYALQYQLQRSKKAAA